MVDVLQAKRVGIRTITKRIQKRIDNGFTIDCPPHGTYYLLCPARPHVWHKYVLGIKGECITRVWWPLVPIEVYTQYLEFKREIHKLDIMRRFKTRQELSSIYPPVLLHSYGEPCDGTDVFYKQEALSEAPHPYEGKSFKIRVTPEESEKVQKKAFKLGYIWNNIDSTHVHVLDSMYLFFAWDGDKLRITHSTGQVWFDESSHIELTPQQFLDGDLPEDGYKVDVAWKQTDAYIDRNGNVYLRSLEGKTFKAAVKLSELHEYNILSEKEFKSKHPDKLKFKEWDVVEKGDDIKVGCLVFFKADLKAFLSVVDEIFLNKCDCRDVQRFLIDNRKQLGL